MQWFITMDTSSAYSGSASDRKIVEISNLTKLLIKVSPFPLIVLYSYKGFDIRPYICLFYIETNFRSSIVLKNANP